VADCGNVGGSRERTYLGACATNGMVPLTRNGGVGVGLPPSQASWWPPHPFPLSFRKQTTAPKNGAELRIIAAVKKKTPGRGWGIGDGCCWSRNRRGGRPP